MCSAPRINNEVWVAGGRRSKYLFWEHSSSGQALCLKNGREPERRHTEIGCHVCEES